MKVVKIIIHVILFLTCLFPGISHILTGDNAKDYAEVLFGFFLLMGSVAWFYNIKSDLDN